MPPHYAYFPACFGYYYFRPYNYTNVLQHMEVVKRLNGDSRWPYDTSMFTSIYEGGVYEEEDGFYRVPSPFATVNQPLPDLQELLKK